MQNNGQSQDAERGSGFILLPVLDDRAAWLNQAMIEMFELLGKGSDGHTELPTWLSSHPELGEQLNH
ncbi:hypothetical protein O9992_06775 [Vibrio lentus]|nr:hypothetical protein [Vibrio lentus]